MDDTAAATGSHSRSGARVPVAAAWAPRDSYIEIAHFRGDSARASDWLAALHAREPQLSVQNLDLGSRAAAASLEAALAETRPTDALRHGRRVLDWMEEIRRRLMADYRAHPKREQSAVRTWLTSWTLHPALRRLRDPAHWPADLRSEGAALWSRVDTDIAELAAAVSRLGAGD